MQSCGRYSRQSRRQSIIVYVQESLSSLLPSHLLIRVVSGLASERYGVAVVRVCAACATAGRGENGVEPGFSADACCCCDCDCEWARDRPLPGSNGGARPESVDGDALDEPWP